MNEQLMYKLAALDAALQGGFRRLDEKMDRFQKDLHDSHVATNDKINKLDKETAAKFEFKRAKIDGMETRIVRVETWQAVAMAKIGAVVTMVTLVWVLLAPSLRHVLGIANS